MEIQIRHSEPEDIPFIKKIYEQETGFSNTLQLPYPSIQKWQQFLADPPDGFYSLVACTNDTIVGQVGMEVFTNPRRKHAANIGMAVCEAHRNMGVASALVNAILRLAHDWLAIKRIELEVYTDNEPAIALYKKHGFLIEGTAKAYAFRNGKYTDVYLMAKVKEDSEP